MSRHDNVQLNIRSAFARARAHEIARRTGMTATEVVEDALRGYVPAAEPKQVGALVRRGPLLVLPVSGRRRVSLTEANEALDTTRDRDN
ncbi:MAG TPA: type II toxin-antitoxin system VapB family antitoxin [Acetobacteraceae bacterium]|nr:type II toxin-antitoxin system VapB family antitoxin [Acetobacteraceae bacterium]